ncbi:hypothetical protein ACW2Q0_18295 [Nocardia sp. R16R-3T]
MNDLASGTAFEPGGAKPFWVLSLPHRSLATVSAERQGIGIPRIGSGKRDLANASMSD